MFPKIGVPQNGWLIVENPIKMDDLGVPFLETYVEVSLIDPMNWLIPRFRTQGTVARSATIGPYAPRAKFTILVVFCCQKKIVARNAAGGVHPRGCVGVNQGYFEGYGPFENGRLEPQENYLENQLLFPSTLPLVMSVELFVFSQGG